MLNRKSLEILNRAHPELQRLIQDAAKLFPMSVIASTRGRADQMRAYRMGKSRAKFGESPHNFIPSLAVDIVPYPLDWEDFGGFREMNKVIQTRADILKISIRRGETFSFVDMPHIELRDWRNLRKNSALVED